MRSFAEIAADPAAQLDALALALAAQFRDVDEDAALARLDELAAEVRDAAAAHEPLDALAEVLGRRRARARWRRGRGMGAR